MALESRADFESGTQIQMDGGRPERWPRMGDRCTAEAWLAVSSRTTVIAICRAVMGISVADVRPRR